MTRHTGTAVFLVRACWEEGQFRARIRYYVDLDQGTAGETQIATAELDEVGWQLSNWLSEAASVHAPDDRLHNDSSGGTDA